LDSDAFQQVLPGFSQSEEDADLLFQSGPNPSPSCAPLPELTAQLSVYRGKELITPYAEAGPSNPHRNDEKAYAWSRGIGTELSPLQTRSSRKKKDTLST
jgi:hypothetical protein